MKQIVESLFQSLDVPSTIWGYNLNAYSIMKEHQATYKAHAKKANETLRLYLYERK